LSPKRAAPHTTRNTARPEIRNRPREPRLFFSSGAGRTADAVTPPVSDILAHVFLFREVSVCHSEELRANTHPSMQIP
jgi:hypothetical protein